MKDLLTRKRFMEWLLGIGAVFTAFVLAFPLIRYVNPPKRSSEGGEWIDAGEKSDMPAGSSVDLLSSRGIPIILISQGNDKFIALEKKCPHLGCMVLLEDGELVCPCHGAKFTLEGQLIGGPSPRGLNQFAVKIHPDNHVFVGKELS